MITLVKNANLKKIISIIGIILFLPILILIVTSTVQMILNLGVDFGTVLRIIFEKIKC